MQICLSVNRSQTSLRILSLDTNFQDLRLDPTNYEIYSFLIENLQLLKIKNLFYFIFCFGLPHLA